MKIAVTYENGKVFQHFGHTEWFKVYEVENNKITSVTLVSAKGSGHSALAGFLKNMGVSVLICGGLGDGAKTTLAEKDIQFFGGVEGNTDEAVLAFMANKLDFDPEIKCNNVFYHGGECGEQNHYCGHHHLRD